MGLSDRDYSRPTPTPAARPGMPPVIKWLLFLNIALFLVCMNPAAGFYAAIQPGSLPLGPPKGFLGSGLAQTIGYWGVDVPLLAFKHGQIWRLLTSTFLHEGVFHIFFNMYVLFQFGPWLERHLGSRRFLAFYLICAIGGSLMSGLLAQLPYFQHLWVTPGIGASGAIYGVLLGLAVIAPNARIMLLIPPIPMSLRTFALVMLGIGVFFVGTKGHNYGGELVHLCGGGLGALLAWKPRLLSWIPASAPAGWRNSRPKTHRGKRIVDADVLDEDQAKQSAEIDAILDKVSAHGLHSLNDEERKQLERYRQGMR